MCIRDSYYVVPCQLTFSLWISFFFWISSSSFSLSLRWYSSRFSCSVIYYMTNSLLKCAALTLCLTLANLASICCFLSCSCLFLAKSFSLRWPPVHHTAHRSQMPNWVGSPRTAGGCWPSWRAVSSFLSVLCLSYWASSCSAAVNKQTMISRQLILSKLTSFQFGILLWVRWFDVVCSMAATKNVLTQIIYINTGCLYQ